MLSGATPDPGIPTLDLSSLPHLADSPVYLVSAAFGIDSIRSLADQIRQSALALHESIQQAVETGVQGGWADGPPASVRMAADDLASAIRSQVEMCVSQSGALADQIRQSALALHESIQQAVETGVQGGWADGPPASVRMAADDLASAIRSQVEMSVSQSGALAEQIRSRIFAELGRE